MVVVYSGKQSWLNSWYLVNVFQENLPFKIVLAVNALEKVKSNLSCAAWIGNSKPCSLTTRKVALASS